MSTTGHPVPQTMRRAGAITGSDGSVRWRVWAPRAEAVDLLLAKDDGGEQIVSMERDHADERLAEAGYFTVSRPGVPDGQRYWFRLNGADRRPDPCSLWQPEGVQGPSAVYRPQTHRWSDKNWRGIARQDLVIYELHVGTFTAEGTFDAIIPRLPELRELGITLLELMPVGQFPGSRNWGYDGVLPYATQDSYGGPQGLQRLVDACHREGLGIILDVVYNHFGPEGNYLHEFGPYFTDAYKTPWGQAINYDAAGSSAVRDFVLDNARMWLEEFHFDGLRLDAIHAIYDLGARHILRAIKEIAVQVAQRAGRTIHIIGESDLNDPRVLWEQDRGGHGLDGQWADDFHHSVHAFLTGERRGYYADFGEASHLARSLQTPFVYDWKFSPQRGRKHGAPTGDLRGDRFVVCIQNHDQVGNRAMGDRLASLLESAPKLRLAASLLLLSPYTPLLFMGEEYGERNPFPFFCSFHGQELLQAVREGRKREFADFLTADMNIPDPGGVATFSSAILSWEWPEGSLAGAIRALYRDLLTARRSWPALRDASRTVRLLPDERHPHMLELARSEPGSEGRNLLAIFNLTDRPQDLTVPISADQTILFSSELTRYGGTRSPVPKITSLEPFECTVAGHASWWSNYERKTPNGG